jgi:hypothetical protein
MTALGYATQAQSLLCRDDRVNPPFTGGIGESSGLKSEFRVARGAADGSRGYSAHGTPLTG